MGISDRAWNLHDEFKYLETIGQHNTGTQSIPRVEMLKRYIEAQQRRTNWGGLDRNEALRMAMKRLQQAVLDTLKSEPE